MVGRTKIAESERSSPRTGAGEMWGAHEGARGGVPAQDRQLTTAKLVNCRWTPPSGDAHLHRFGHPGASLPTRALEPLVAELRVDPHRQQERDGEEQQRIVARRYVSRRRERVETRRNRFREISTRRSTTSRPIRARRLHGCRNRLPATRSTWRLWSSRSRGCATRPWRSMIPLIAGCRRLIAPGGVRSPWRVSSHRRRARPGQAFARIRHYAKVAAACCGKALPSVGSLRTHRR